MMLNLLVIIIPLALLDSLNPVTIAVHVYLLGTPRPETRTLAFVAGIFAAYFAGGLILAAGLGQILAFFAGLSDATWNWIQMAVAWLLLGFVAYLWLGAKNKSSAREDADKPASLAPHSTFWLGFAVTISDLPTAIPYIAAVERMLQAGLSIGGVLFATFVYNLIYVAPLIALYGIHLFLGERSASVLRRVSEFIDRWSPPVLGGLSAIAGLVIFADSILFFFGGSLF